MHVDAMKLPNGQWKSYLKIQTEKQRYLTQDKSLSKLAKTSNIKSKMNCVTFLREIVFIFQLG